MSDHDDLDGCDLDFGAAPVADEDLDLFVLSPEGDESVLDAYRELFPDKAE